MPSGPGADELLHDPRTYLTSLGLMADILKSVCCRLTGMYENQLRLVSIGGSGITPYLGPKNLSAVSLQNLIGVWHWQNEPLQTD